MNVTLRSGARTDVGRTRSSNEDSLFVGTHLFAVADGLGGHRGGEVASAVAIDSMRPLADRDAAGAAKALAETIRAANKAVLDRSRQDPALSGMGTTMTALVIDGASAHLGHVGDSRAYLLRNGTIEQLTQDHTMVARMVRDGRLTPEEADRHPQRSMLTRALGSEPRVDVDELDVPLAAGDRLLLCSDGLTNMLTDSEIAHIVREGTEPDVICAALVDAANDAGGVDNITAVLVEIEDGPAAPTGAPSTATSTGAGERHRGPNRRALVWSAIVLTLVVGMIAGLRIWANRSWYVGERSGEVAVFQGLPFDLPMLQLQRVAERTGIEMVDLPEFLQREIEDGIQADSATDARRIVTEQIAPNAIEPMLTPTPVGSPTITPVPPAGTSSP